MMPSETTNPPTAAATDAQTSARSAPSRYTLIFSIALTAVTVVALIVAFFSSDFRPRAANALPSSWTQAYNADLTGSDTGQWDETQGCDMNALGLDANPTDSNDAQCAFTPSVKQNVTAHGFYFVTTLAPAANVPAFARSIISIGDISSPTAADGSVIHFLVSQDGAYMLCDGYCTASDSSIYLHGGLASWHGDANVANTVAVKVMPDHSALTVYVNDQEVATITPQFGPQPEIAVGAPAGSEAIFTHAALYTGQ